MKVTVLGFWGGYPEKNEATSGYLFEKDGFRLLVDCGSGVLAQLQNYIEVKDIDAVLLSHYHHDHIADVGVLQYARLIRGSIDGKYPVLPVYGHTLDEKGFHSLQHNGITEAKRYTGEESIQIGPFSISFLKTTHPVDCFAFRIEDGETTVVYSADSSYEEAFIPFTKNADLFICECNMYGNEDAKKAGHMNSLEVAKIAKEANVKELVLTHLPHKGNHQQLVEEAATLFNGEIMLARTGLTWAK